MTEHRAPVQAGRRSAVARRQVERADHLSGPNGGADRQPSADRFVGRPQASRVPHGHDPSPGNQAGEAHHPGPGRPHRLAGPGQQVHSAVAGAPRRGGGLVTPDHRGCRLERPLPWPGWSPDLPVGTCWPSQDRADRHRREGQARQRQRQAEQEMEWSSGHPWSLAGRPDRWPGVAPDLWTAGRPGRACGRRGSGRLGAKGAQPADRVLQDVLLLAEGEPDQRPGRVLVIAEHADRHRHHPGQLR